MKITNRNRYKVYLAGPICGLYYDEATDWRQDAIKCLDSNGIDGISPMRSKEFLEGKIIDDRQEHMDSMATRSAITDRDRWDTLRSDIVLMNLLDEHKISIGTCIEIGQADIKRIPIIIVCQEDGIYDKHPMINHICGFKARTVEDGLDIAIRMLSI